jgi:hypothetical protein
MPSDVPMKFTSEKVGNEYLGKTETVFVSRVFAAESATDSSSFGENNLRSPP